MKRINKTSIFTIILLFIFLILNILDSKAIIKLDNSFDIIYISFVLLFIKLLSRKELFRNRDNKENVKKTLIFVISSLLVYFLLGLVFGYSYNVYGNSAELIIKNTLFIILPLVLQEYIRYYLLYHSSNKKIIIVLITILFILVNLNFNTLINLNDNKKIFIYIFNDLFLIVIKNILLTYISLIYGYYSSMAYQITISCFTMFIPILPSYNYFLKFLFNLLVNIYIYYKISNSVKREYFVLSKKIKLPLVIFYLLVVLVLCLNFGLFKYKNIAIMSNSMQPLFSRGDMVIYEKNIDNLKENDIIIFNNSNEIYVHRITKIRKKNDKNFYVTKGDANSREDKGTVSENDIIGKYIFNIPYLGYPSVLLNEIFSK